MANYTDVDDSSSAFQIKPYSGSNSSNAVTFDGNSNLQPDWLWLKKTNGGTNHFAYDAIRGVTASLVPNDTDGNSTGGQEATNYLTSFNSNGFTVAGNYNNTNKSGNSYVAWGWKGANSTASNSNGSITSTVSANTAAGFSIVSWTGNQSAGATIGHGLGVAPSVLIDKKTSSSGTDWFVYHKSMGSSSEEHYMGLNATYARQDQVLAWNDTAPTSSVFTVGAGGSSNGDGATMITYCFAEKRGFSSFGSYVGNGDSNGPFVFTGFKPAWVMVKEYDGSGEWYIKEDRFANQNDSELEANDTDGDDTSKSTGFDLLSNGFKIRGTLGNVNGSLNNFIYFAFAKNPFVTSTGIVGLAE